MELASRSYAARNAVNIKFSYLKLWSRNFLLTPEHFENFSLCQNFGPYEDFVNSLLQKCRVSIARCLVCSVKAYQMPVYTKSRYLCIIGDSLWCFF